MVFSDAVDAALTQGNNDRGTVIAEEALARDLKVTVFPLSCYVVGAPVFECPIAFVLFYTFLSFIIGKDNEDLCPGHTFI